MDVLPLLGMLIVASCNKQGSSSIPEEEEAAYKSAMTLKKDRDKKARALAEFLTVIDSRMAAPKSHLEVGLLYLDRGMGDPDPISAIYHFKKYLEFVPDLESQQGRRVRGRIELAERMFMARLPGDPYQTSGDNSLQLEELIKRLQEENQQLRTQLDQLTNRTQEFSLQDNNPETPAPRIRIYKVNPGDTLFKIASKVYGDPGRWREIYDANRSPQRNDNPMRNENDLQPGQELFIP